MPSTAERERMDRLEERLQSAIEQPELAVLVDISTGGNEKFWEYYSKSAYRFLEVMNKSLASEPRFPIRVHVNYDPLWKVYNDFRKDMKEWGHPPLPR